MKAVNPHRVVEEDKRTALEIIQAITEKEREATAALTRLRALITTNNSFDARDDQTGVTVTIDIVRPAHPQK